MSVAGAWGGSGRADAHMARGGGVDSGEVDQHRADVSGGGVRVDGD